MRLFPTRIQAQRRPGTGEVSVVTQRGELSERLLGSSKEGPGDSAVRRDAQDSAAALVSGAEGSRARMSGIQACVLRRTSLKCSNISAMDSRES